MNNQRKNLYVGIDPGAKGGIVSIDGESIVLQPMFIKPAYLANYLTHLVYRNQDAYDVRFMVERSHAMPGQGVVSMFNYGAHYGTICGILHTLLAKFDTVHPRTWTTLMHAGYDKTIPPKERSKQKATELFGIERFMVNPRSKKPHDGLIDAALIAEYSRLLHTGSL